MLWPPLEFNFGRFSFSFRLVCFVVFRVYFLFCWWSVLYFAALRKLFCFSPLLLIGRFIVILGFFVDLILVFHLGEKGSLYWFWCFNFFWCLYWQILADQFCFSAGHWFYAVFVLILLLIVILLLVFCILVLVLFHHWFLVSSLIAVIMSEAIEISHVLDAPETENTVCCF